MKLDLNAFLKYHKITKKSLAESIGWTANSLSQALRNEGESSTFLLKFAQSKAFPRWTIGYDFEKKEYTFIDKQPGRFEGVGGYDFFTWPKSFLLKENDFFNPQPHIFSFIAALPCDEVDIYEDGKYLHVMEKNGDREFGAFPVEDMQNLVEFMRNYYEEE